MDKNEMNELKASLSMKDRQIKDLRKQVEDLEFDLKRKTVECEAFKKVREAFQVLVENT